MRSTARRPKGPRHISEVTAEALTDVDARMKARRLFERGDMAVIDFVAELVRDPEIGRAVIEVLNWHLGSDDVGGRHRAPKKTPQRASHD